MEDVAREAGVSRALVSLVFRGMPQVSERRRRAVLEAADRLGYRRNAAASRLASRRSTIVAVVISDLANPLMAEGTQLLQEHAEAAGHQIILGAANRSPRREQAVVDALLEYRPAGLILVGSRLPDARIGRVAEQVPTVLLGRISTQPVDCLALDDAFGAELVVEHLVGLGHRDVLHIDGGNEAGAAQRRVGFRRTMKRLGLGDSAEVVPGEFTEEAGVRTARAVLERPKRPTAIFAANDLVAVGALGELESAGVCVPQDLSIVGYDDTSIARLGRVALTSVAHPLVEMSRLAVEALAERISDPNGKRRTTLVAPRLVIRRSSAPPTMSPGSSARCVPTTGRTAPAQPPSTGRHRE